MLKRKPNEYLLIQVFLAFTRGWDKANNVIYPYVNDILKFENTKTSKPPNDRKQP